MANDWFQFKEFRIQQDRCAMKVTTDACVFGAWLSDRIPPTPQVLHALDIGTGTGLLSLMLAQQHSTILIDAVELDEAAATQAFDNVCASPFAKQIQVHHADFLAYAPGKKYDLIFSNPPFHQQQLKGNNSSRNKAHHDDGLTLEELIPKAVNMLSEHGKIALLLPYYRLQEMLTLAKSHQLYPLEICSVKQSAQHDFFRVLFLLGKNDTGSTVHTTLQIRDDAPSYSSAFEKLLQPYYLKL
ncbi:MAG TPA: methyltransferase [Phnomibacter sp.]|nr:methyltransferase [Phnomibacter sp.]